MWCTHILTTAVCGSDIILWWQTKPKRLTDNDWRTGRSSAVNRSHIVHWVIDRFISVTHVSTTSAKRDVTSTILSVKDPLLLILLGNTAKMSLNYICKSCNSKLLTYPHYSLQWEDPQTHRGVLASSVAGGCYHQLPPPDNSATPRSHHQGAAFLRAPLRPPDRFHHTLSPR